MSPEPDRAPPLLPRARQPDTPRPLAGIRVVDLTVAVAGPISTQLLASLGADVIRIETPWGRPRTPATVAPSAAGAAALGDGADAPWNRIPLYNELNQGKRSLILNLLDPQGREVLLDLVECSDVLVENFAPRVMGNFDLEWDVLRERNPGLVFVSMPAFGKEGPLRDRVSYGPGIDAMSGLSWLSGYADEGPLKPGNFYCDQNAGLHTALAVVSALRARERTGRGQTVELAMIEGELQLVADALLDVQFSGREPARMGNAHHCWAPHGVYPAAGDDAWIAIVCRDDQDWASLCAELALDGFDIAADDPRFRTALRRWKHRDALDDLLRGWTSRHEPQALAERLQAGGVPASNVQGARDLLLDPQFLAREAAVTVPHAGVGPSPVPQPAFRLSRTPTPPAKAAPLFAEDNDYVFHTLLRYDRERVRGLIDAGVTSYALMERPPR